MNRNTLIEWCPSCSRIEAQHTFIEEGDAEIFAAQKEYQDEQRNENCYKCKCGAFLIAKIRLG